MSDAGTYFCRVTADNGQYVDSEVAQLKVPSPTLGQVCTGEVGTHCKCYVQRIETKSIILVICAL